MREEACCAQTAHKKNEVNEVTAEDDKHPSVVDMSAWSDDSGSQINYRKKPLAVVWSLGRSRGY